MFNQCIIVKYLVFLFRYKLALADVVIEKINPIRTLIEEYMDEPQYLNHVLQEGAKRAEIIAIIYLFSQIYFKTIKDIVIFNLFYNVQKIIII